MNKLSSLELCAGGGGQALGLEQAGFGHDGLVEDRTALLQHASDQPAGKAGLEKDLRDFAEHDAKAFKGVDLLAAGLPCPPFSIAGKQLGTRDERNLFPSPLI